MEQKWFKCICGNEYKSGYTVWANNETMPFQLQCASCTQKAEQEKAEREARRFGTFVTEKRECSGNCGRQIEFVVRKAADGTSKFLKTFCDECAAKLEKQDTQREYEQQKLDKETLHTKRAYEWALLCPVAMREKFEVSRLHGKTHTTKLQAVLQWQRGNKGLFLYGNTATGKTRSIFTLLRRLYVDECVDVQLYDVSLAERVNALSSTDSGRFYQFLLSVQTIPVLFIDELTGKGNFTPKYKQFLFDVLDYRMKWKLPTFATENNDAERLRERSGDNVAFGEPFIERIKQGFQVICFDNEPLNKEGQK